VGVEIVVIAVGQRVAVLGASGFIGSHLVDALLARGCHVRALCRSFPGLICPEVLAHPQLDHRQLDFNNPVGLQELLAGVEVCFHLISTTLPASSNLDPGHDVQTNLGSTIQLLEAARQVGVRRIVFTSSGGTVYGQPATIPIPEDHPNNPTCSYGITKLAIEKYLALYRTLYGLESVVLRVANPYGDRQRQAAAQGVIAVFLGRALRHEPIEIWGDGNVVRDYVYVGDVASALLSAADYQGYHHIFNIGSGHGLSLNQLIHAVEKELGRPVRANHQPGRGFDVPVNVLDISLAASELGWFPQVPFSEGLARLRVSLSQTCRAEGL
jgi:UDP-glucose 4-epimerase